MAAIVESQIGRDDFDAHGSRRKLTWITRDHDADHAPNSILCDPPIQRGSGRFRGYGESPLGTSGRFRGYGESPLGASERFRSPGPLESPMGASGRFRSPAASETPMGASGRFQTLRGSAALETPVGASGRFRSSGASENLVGASGRFRSFGASENPVGTSGRFRSSGASETMVGGSGRSKPSGVLETPMGSSGRFRSPGVSDSPMGASGHFRSPGASDGPISASGRFRSSGASESVMGGSGRFRVSGASDVPTGNSGRFRVYGIPESPVESPARRGESVRRLRAHDVDSDHDASLVSTDSADHDKLHVSTNAAETDKSPDATNSVNHEESSALTYSSKSGSFRQTAKRSGETTFDLSLIKPGRSTHSHLVDTIVESDQSEETEEQMKPELEDSGQLSSGEKSSDGGNSSVGLSSSGEKLSEGSSSSSSSTRPSFSSLEKDRLIKPKGFQNPRSVSFSAAHTTDHETKSDAILQGAKETHSRPSLLGSPFLVDHPKNPLTDSDGWGSPRTSSAIMARIVERRRLGVQNRSPSPSPSPLSSNDRDPRPERERSFRSPPSPVSSELENPSPVSVPATKVGQTERLDQNNSAALAPHSTSEGKVGVNNTKFGRKEQEDVRLAIERELGRRRSFNGFTNVDPANVSILRFHKGNAKVSTKTREGNRRIEPKMSSIDAQGQKSLSEQALDSQKLTSPAATAAAPPSQRNADVDGEALPTEQQKRMNEGTFPKDQQKLMNSGTFPKELQKQLYQHLHPLNSPSQGAQVRGHSVRSRSQRVVEDLEKPPAVLEKLLNEEFSPMHSKKTPAPGPAPHFCQCDHETVGRPVFHSAGDEANAHTKTILHGSGLATPPALRSRMPIDGMALSNRNPTENLFPQDQQPMWNYPGYHTDKWTVDIHRLTDYENNVHFSRVETPISNSRRVHDKFLPQMEPVNFVPSNTQNLTPDVYRTLVQSHPGTDGQHPLQRQEQPTTVYYSPESQPVTHECSILPRSRKGRSSSPGGQVHSWFFNPFRSKSNPKSKFSDHTDSTVKNNRSSSAVVGRMSANGSNNQIVGAVLSSVDVSKQVKTPRKKSPWKIFHVITGKSSKKGCAPPITAVAPVSDFRADQSHRFASTRFETSTNSPLSRIGMEAQLQHQNPLSTLPIAEAGSYASPPVHGYRPTAQIQPLNGYEWASTPSHRLNLSHAHDGGIGSGIYISTPSHRFVPVESGMVAATGRLGNGEVSSFHRGLMLLEQQLQPNGNAGIMSLPSSYSSPRNSSHLGSTEASGYATPAHPAQHRLSQMEAASSPTPARRSLRMDYPGRPAAAHGLLTDESSGGATPAHRNSSYVDVSYKSTPSHHLHQGIHQPGTPVHRKICVDVAGDGTPIHRNAYLLPPVPNAFPATHTNGVQNFYNDIELRRG